MIPNNFEWIRNLTFSFIIVTIISHAFRVDVKIWRVFDWVLTGLRTWGLHWKGLKLCSRPQKSQDSFHCRESGCLMSQHPFRLRPFQRVPRIRRFVLCLTTSRTWSGAFRRLVKPRSSKCGEKSGENLSYLYICLKIVGTYLLAFGLSVTMPRASGVGRGGFRVGASLISPPFTFGALSTAVQFCSQWSNRRGLMQNIIGKTSRNIE